MNFVGMSYCVFRRTLVCSVWWWIPTSTCPSTLMRLWRDTRGTRDTKTHLTCSPSQIQLTGNSCHCLGAREGGRGGVAMCEFFNSWAELMWTYALANRGLEVYRRVFPAISCSSFYGVLQCCCSFEYLRNFLLYWNFCSFPKKWRIRFF